jgi:glycerate 2-kinase
MIIFDKYFFMNTVFNILIAPDSFKGSISAADISQILSQGLLKSNFPLGIESIPLADGGEGSMDAIRHCTNLIRVEQSVSDPLSRKTDACYLMDHQNRKAYIELAQASGLGLMSSGNDIIRASTYGTGQLIKHAIESGSAEIVLFLGGSASCDAGLGIARALGIRFFNSKGDLLVPFAGNMVEISDFDVSGSLLNANRFELLLAVDVNNPFYGPKGASYVYSPQKGATPEQVEQLDTGLQNLALVIKRKTGIDLQSVPGSGAAGGAAGGLHAFFGAMIISGTDFIFEILHLEEKIRKADLIITGEGKIDSQTLNQKLIHGISKLCRNNKKKLWVVCGFFDGDEELIRTLGIEKIFSMAGYKEEIEDSILNPEKHLNCMIDDIVQELAQFF